MTNNLYSVILFNCAQHFTLILLEGPLCEWQSTGAALPDEFDTFEEFRDRSLTRVCTGGGTPGILTWTPDANTPDTVYYQVRLGYLNLICSMCILDFMQATLFCLRRFLKKLADDQYSSISKGSIYYIKHTSIEPFAMGMGWPEINHLMEVSIMFDICTYCVFTLYSSNALTACFNGKKIFCHEKYSRLHILSQKPLAQTWACLYSF